ncbi:MAG: hypothetical protein ACE5R3_02690 [Nitrosopumilaceae archaeon]
MKGSVFVFIGIMWILIIIGGGIIVTILGPISVTGYGELDQIFSSGIKALIAVILVVIWILILSKMKNWIFRKEIKS